MGTRLELHSELLKFLPNVYFQPPSTITMKYPCIVYTKSDKSNIYGNDHLYSSTQGYKLTIIDRNPDSTTADDIEKYFSQCAISQYYVVDGLNHTTLNLYY